MKYKFILFSPWLLKNPVKGKKANSKDCHHPGSSPSLNPKHYNYNSLP